MKVVLDTNVLLAAFATRGLCEAVMMACLEHHQLVLSEAILTEAERHLRKKFKIQATRVAEITAFLRVHAILVTPAEVPKSACADADDLPILGTAKAGAAAVLVTGDQDLLKLKQFDGIPILTPRAFYERLRA